MRRKIHESHGSRGRVISWVETWTVRLSPGLVPPTSASTFSRAAVDLIYLENPFVGDSSPKSDYKRRQCIAFVPGLLFLMVFFLCVRT